jgi:hypothetical protein
MKKRISKARNVTMPTLAQFLARKVAAHWRSREDSYEAQNQLLGRCGVPSEEFRAEYLAQLSKLGYPYKLIGDDDGLLSNDQPFGPYSRPSAQMAAKSKGPRS